MQRLLKLTAAALLVFVTPGFAQTPNWFPQNPTLKPSSRDNQQMVYDVARSQCVMFGGDSGNGMLGDTWTYDGVNWTRHKPTTSPNARSLHVMAYDTLRKVSVLFGGRETLATIKRDTWLWDGKNWTKLSYPFNGKPSARIATAMTFDSARGVAVLFGGYDPKLGLVNDTWELSITGWTKRTPLASPPGRQYHKMAYDQLRKRVVMFGGDGSGGLRQDTWEYDGVTWKEIKPSTSPVKSHSHAMVYDGGRRRVLLQGGDNPATFEWDGVNWTKIATANSPQRKYEHSMAYDAKNLQVVMFGGNVSGERTWTYVGNACVFSVDVDTISTVNGGAQKLAVDAGKAYAGFNYWVFGTVTGTSPGIRLLGVDIPLNIDLYTNFTISSPNVPPLSRFRGVLDVDGKATAGFRLPANVLNAKFTMNHSYILFNNRGQFLGGSNAVALTFN